MRNRTLLEMEFMRSGKRVLVGWRGRGVLGALGAGEARGWGMWAGRGRS